MEIDPERLIRRVAGAARLLPVARHLVEGLSRVRAIAPADSWLILGGSFARGEPCIRFDGEQPKVLSDFDLVLVHPSPTAPPDAEELLEAVRRVIPYADLYPMRLDQYVHLGTAIGMDVKRDAIAVNRADLPEHVVPSLSVRDAFEVGIYALVEIFENEVIRRAYQDDHRLEFLYLVNRTCLNLLRSAAMLKGTYAYHDPVAGDEALSAAIRQELDWRDGQAEPTSSPLERVLLAMRLSLKIHSTDGHYARFPDSVTGSEYEGALGSHYVAFYQRLVLELAREFLSRADEAAPHEAELSAWNAVVSRQQIARTPHAPARFFRERHGMFCDQLLQMKVAFRR